MRLVHASTFAVAVALLGSTMSAQMDPDRVVPGGGIFAPGWKGRIDPGSIKQGRTINDSKFTQEGSTLTFAVGPAAIYWNPANTAKGDYTVKATFTEPQQASNHPHPFGIFIGGSKLDTDEMSLIYCTAYRDGSFLVRGLTGAMTAVQYSKRQPNAAVHKTAGKDESVTQEIAWTVKGGRAECSINGTVVAGFDRSELVGPGKLESTDGIFGIRLSHNMDATVTGFGLTKGT